MNTAMYSLPLLTPRSLLSCSSVAIAVIWTTLHNAFCLDTRFHITNTATAASSLLSQPDSDLMQPQKSSSLRGLVSERVDVATPRIQRQAVQRVLLCRAAKFWLNKSRAHRQRDGPRPQTCQCGAPSGSEFPELGRKRCGRITKE